MDPTPHDYPSAGFELDARRPPPPLSPLEVVKHAMAAVPQLSVLVYRLLRDPAVPRRRKALAAVAVAYVVSPIDLIPDFIPVIGAMDDLIMLALAAHMLIESVPDEVQQAYWEGSEDLFELIRGLLAWGAEMVPLPLRRFVG